MNREGFPHLSDPIEEYFNFNDMLGFPFLKLDFYKYKVTDLSFCIWTWDLLGLWFITRTFYTGVQYIGACMWHVCGYLKGIKPNHYTPWLGSNKPRWSSHLWLLQRWSSRHEEPGEVVEFELRFLRLNCKPSYLLRHLPSVHSHFLPFYSLFSPKENANHALISSLETAEWETVNSFYIGL